MRLQWQPLFALGDQHDTPLPLSKLTLGLGYWKNLTGSTYGADLSHSDLEVGLNAGNLVKVSARMYRPCAAPVTVRLASRGRFATMHGRPAHRVPGALTLNSLINIYLC